MEYPVSILVALHEVMEAVGYVEKKSKNDFHNYSYASEEDLLTVLRPAMVKAGLMILPSTKQVVEIDKHGNTFVQVEYTLCHKDGSVWPEKLHGYGCGNDRNKNGVGDKGLYKALTGANKYMLFKTFQIATGNDPEQFDEAPEVISDEQREEMNRTEFLTEGFAHMPSSQELELYWKKPDTQAAYTALQANSQKAVRQALTARNKTLIAEEEKGEKADA
tara:strand:+ start:4112 stop:4768 length:657 start_codon:yes stop_codon:yes gene_type:complete